MCVFCARPKTNTNTEYDLFMNNIPGASSVNDFQMMSSSHNTPRLQNRRNTFTFKERSRSWKYTKTLQMHKHQNAMSRQFHPEVKHIYLSVCLSSVRPSVCPSGFSFIFSISVYLVSWEMHVYVPIFSKQGDGDNFSSVCIKQFSRVIRLFV